MSKTTQTERFFPEISSMEIWLAIVAVALAAVIYFVWLGENIVAPQGAMALAAITPIYAYKIGLWLAITMVGGSLFFGALCTMLTLWGIFFASDFIDDWQSR
jgi:hypothetical protein